MKPIIAVPATLALVYRAYSRKSLTPLGIIVAALTAVVHALHPWSAPFALLCVFFLGGTTTTKVKHDVKARLTLSASGASGGEGARTHVQVLANSLAASILILLHTWQLRRQTDGHEKCWGYGSDLLVVGIVANYAAVAADTFSSELGILSAHQPRLLTSPTFRTVPPGTNGGVTLAGILAGFLGASTIALTSVILLPFCGGSAGTGPGWSLGQKIGWVGAVTLWGGLGSLVDSFLGGVLQASVVDVRTGKIVEGSGGRKVLVTSGPSSGFSPQKGSSASSSSLEHLEKTSQQRRGQSSAPAGSDHSHHPSRSLLSGLDILDNNGVNLLMASLMSLGGMVVAGWAWDVPLVSLLS